MWKVLVVDDEKHSRATIVLLLKQMDSQKFAIKEASNGKEGLKLLDTFHPDMVFVDMKMPVMDGIEFLQKAVKRYNDIKYIVVSGYDEFHYAKKAMECNAVNYILKPVDRHEFLEVITKLLRTLKEEYEFKNKKSEMENYAVQKMIENVIDNPENIEEYHNHLNKMLLKKDDIQFYTVLIYFYNHQQLKLQNMIPYVQNYFHDDVQCFCFEDKKVTGRLTVLIQYSYRYEAVKDPNDLEKSIFLLVTALEYKFHSEVIACVSDRFRSVNELYVSFCQAEYIFNNRNVLDNTTKVFLSSHIVENVGSLMDEKINAEVNELLHHVNVHTGEYNAEVLENYFCQLEKENYLNINHLRQIFDKFIGLLNDTEIMYKFVHVSICTITQLRETVFNMLDFYANHCNVAVDTGDRYDVAESIKEYIDLYYYQDINLDFFSKHYFLTKEYLIKIFKKRFGVGIHEYLLRVRMNKAAELLKNNHLKVKKIAEQVGYDEKYFSKAYKKFFGVSPSKHKRSTS